MKSQFGLALHENIMNTEEVLIFPRSTTLQILATIEEASPSLSDLSFSRLRKRGVFQFMCETQGGFDE